MEAFYIVSQAECGKLLINPYREIGFIDHQQTGWLPSRSGQKKSALPGGWGMGCRSSYITGPLCFLSQPMVIPSSQPPKGESSVIPDAPFPALSHIQSAPSYATSITAPFSFNCPCTTHHFIHIHGGQNITTCCISVLQFSTRTFCVHITRREILPSHSSGQKSLPESPSTAVIARDT